MAAPSTGRLEQIAFSGFLVVVALGLLHSGWLLRWDQLLYDLHLRTWSRPAPDDVIIIEIDEASLYRYGQWPWPRAVHARLIERLTAAGARAIALDIIFSEPARSDDDGDRQLAAAIAANGRTVLPVLVETHFPSGQLVEQLPIPALSASAAALGHVHVELDRDGIARSVYLKEGLGDPHWPTLGLAMLALTGEAPSPLPGLRAPMPGQSMHAWARDYHVLVPFAGPPDHFRRVAYVGVLEGRYDAEVFRDKYVLVGMTAAGLGDALPTPVSGHNRFMAGVEFNANVLDALRSGLTLRVASSPYRLALTVALALLPGLLYFRVTPRWGLLTAAGLLLGTLAGSSIALNVGQVWYPPMAALFAIALSYPVWSGWRLAKAMRYLDAELTALTGEQQRWDNPAQLPIESRVEFAAGMLRAQGWCFRALPDGKPRAQGVEINAIAPPRPHDRRWMQDGDLCWAWRSESGTDHEIVFKLSASTDLPALDRARLEGLASPPPAAIPSSRASLEIMQTRINQIQAVTSQVRAARTFIDQGLAQMVDGVLVAGGSGRVRLANPRAGEFLCVEPGRPLVGQSVLELVDRLSFEPELSSMETVRAVLSGQLDVQLHARNRDGTDLLVQLSVLRLEASPMNGLIVSMADISLLKESERKRNEVLGFLSHDIRSPLVSILALVELADVRQSAEELQALFHRAGGYAEKTLALAEQLLELAHAESTERSRWVEYDLVALANSAFEQVWDLARSKDIRLQWQTELEQAWLNGEPELIERAIVNLLTNAVKYSDAGTTTTLTIDRERDGYCVIVEDQGIGISTEDIPHLFERFRRLPGASSEQGTGLGLAFVKAVADAHGAGLSVDSKVGSGSTFRMKLIAELDRD